MFDTAIAGSLPKPAWLAETGKLWPQWMAEGDALAQAKLDATVEAFMAQQEVITALTTAVPINLPQRRRILLSVY